MHIVVRELSHAYKSNSCAMDYEDYGSKGIIKFCNNIDNKQKKFTQPFLIKP